MEIDKTQNDDKGTSLVTINSEKGRNLFAELKSNFQHKEIKIAPNKLSNRFHAVYAANKNRQRFFHLAKNKSITDAATMAFEGKYDIGLVSNYCAPNFGGQLTHYALYHTLEDLGYSTLVIRIPSNTLKKESVYRESLNYTCLEPLYEEYNLSKEYSSALDMEELNNICSQFVVGSDQLFQYVLYNLFDQMVSLKWVESRKKKIAIAASFGHDYIFGDAEVHADLAYWLKRYDYFSVREASGVEICKNNYGIHAEHVLDPVFLVDKKHYDNLVKKASCVLPDEYVAFYILDPTIEKGDIIHKIAGLLGINVTGFSEYNSSEKKIAPLYNCNCKNYKMEERLKVISQCNFLITDSFHGTCLAIIMNKPFITYLNKDRGSSRFYSLLKMFGLENRLVVSYEEFKNKGSKLLAPIEWEIVNEKLDYETKKTKQWVANALAAPKSNYNDVYDVLEKRISFIEKQYKKEADQLRRQFNNLVNSLGMSYTAVTDIYAYIDELNKIKKNLLIVITAKDTPGMLISDNLLEQLQLLGIKKLDKNKHWCGYIAVISKGKVIYEKCEYEKAVTYHLKNMRVNLTALSAPLHMGNDSQTIIEGIDYSTKSRGLNFVIYDYNLKCVTDSIGFDTHSKSYVAKRK